MRINKFIAQHSHLSRRQADDAIAAGRVTINSKIALLGDAVTENDVVTLDNQPLNQNHDNVTVLLNKPVGYVCSRNGQGSPTVYDLLPKQYHNLNIAGRLDKDSSGLVVLTSDGDLLHELTHPSKHKTKVYRVELNRELTEAELTQLTIGVDIGDERPSKFKDIHRIDPKKYEITLEEGRNRQIRRSLKNISAKVTHLQRIKLAHFSLQRIEPKNYTKIV